MIGLPLLSYVFLVSFYVLFWFSLCLPSYIPTALPPTRRHIVHHRHHLPSTSRITINQKTHPSPPILSQPPPLQPNWFIPPPHSLSLQSLSRTSLHAPLRGFESRVVLLIAVVGRKGRKGSYDYILYWVWLVVPSKWSKEGKAIMGFGVFDHFNWSWRAMTEYQFIDHLCRQGAPWFYSSY